MNILIIGGGNMGKTMAQSILKAKIATEKELFIFEKEEDKVQELKNEKIGTAFSNPEDYFQKADLFILAVKPQDAHTIYSIIKYYIEDDKMILSIMAGIKTKDIQKNTGAKKIVRAMPNLPAQVGKGATGYYVAQNLSDKENDIIFQLLSTFGIAVEFKEEDKLDAVTAISGSGPAYVFYFLDAMIQASVQLGIDRQDAEKLVIQTFEGSIQLLKENDITCQEWIQRVSSKGGTTEAAIKVFEEFNVKNHIGKGILKAENRSKELSKS